jgi:hypothetical protein
MLRIAGRTMRPDGGLILRDAAEFIVGPRVRADPLALLKMREKSAL